jgi:hypothetical protein
MIIANKKNIVIFLIGFCFAFLLPVFSEEESIQIGGKNGWQNLLVSKNIVSTKGLFGYEAKALAKKERAHTESLDLLLNFDGIDIKDTLDRYHLVNEDLVKTYRKSNDAKTGTAALLSLEKKPLVLSGGEDSFFGSSGYKGSFSISFWIKPFLLQSQERLFSWNSSRNTLHTILDQSIQAFFNKGRLQWQLSNIFTTSEAIETDFLLKGTSMLIPNSWSHHCFVYSEADETIEYYVNGFLEDVQSVKALKPFLGMQADIRLCENYTGLLDAFVIDNDDAVLNGDGAVYSKERGRFETQPIDLGTYGTVVRKLEAEVDIPEQTAVAFFLRSGDNFYEWTETYPAWQPVAPGKQLDGFIGRYVQVAAELYTDGAGKKTPAITDISLFYQKTEAPLAPYMLKAEGGDGYIDLSWAKTLDENTAGYLIYYGESSGEYLGTFALEGKSPIQTDLQEKFRIRGLQNGKIYYFAIRAYSAVDERIIGPFSKEIWARPRENKGAFYE